MHLVFLPPELTFLRYVHMMRLLVDAFRYVKPFVARSR
jgi:hypothetical protein